MTRSSMLSDELVQQLVPVGQVDILVGVPTFNHASTVAPIVQAIHVGLARHFPLERTVLINPDGGSEDGTPDVVRGAPLAAEELRGSKSLRTTHRVSAPFVGLPDRSAGVRTVFAAADLLQARVVVLFSPDLTSLTPDWVADLARPVWKEGYDMVLPIHPRHRFDGQLLHQLVRPLLGTTYGRRLRANLAGHFACSGRFAARALTLPMWQRDPTLSSLETRLVATALAQDVSLAQVHLDVCRFAPRPAAPGLTQLFQDVVGAVFASLESDSPSWSAPDGNRDIPVIGTPRAFEGPEPAVGMATMTERFSSGVRDLAPLLRDILTPVTYANVQSLAASSEGVPLFPDTLWVQALYEFAAAYHREVMNREHLTQALVPLYLGRTASFIEEMSAADDAAIGSRIDALELEFERLRPYLVERWNSEGGN